MISKKTSASEYASQMSDAQKIWVIRSMFTFVFNIRRIYPVDRCVNLFNELASVAGVPSDDSSLFRQKMRFKNVRLCPDLFPRTTEAAARKIFINKCRTAVEWDLGGASKSNRHISLG